MKKVTSSLPVGVQEEGKNKELEPLVKARHKYQRARRCVGSKPAVAVLFWVFAVSIVYNILLFDKHTMAIVLLNKYSSIVLSITLLGYAALLQFFFPLAGYLADTKFGRYRTVHFSLWILELTILCIGIAGILTNFYKSRTTKLIRTGVFYLACLLSLIGLPGFNVNVIQFGLDQLYHTPSEDQSLFIQWYLWAFNASALTVEIVLSSEILTKSEIVLFNMLAVLLFTIATFVLVSLYSFHRQRKWVLIVPKCKNPYSLVYKVTVFGHKYKHPLQRSAFTFCEDDIPRGLDLGKQKYGGPFTTEQVEDVKVFYGVLKIISVLGPVLLIHIAEDRITLLLPQHLTSHGDLGYSNNTSILSNSAINSIIGDGTVNSMVAFILIPLYICVIRPLVRDRIPGMLWRIGIGISVSVLSIILSLAVDVSIHLQNGNTGCIFTTPTLHNTTLSYTEENTPIPAQVLLILQQIFSAISHTVFYVAVYEFICSQSPHSMKGLFLGIFYATRGLYEILGSLLIIPFAMDRYRPLLPSCGMVYYLVNIAIGVAALILYIYTARNYKFRVRDEVCPVRRHVEEYYSKIPEENNSD